MKDLKWLNKIWKQISKEDKTKILKVAEMALVKEIWKPLVGAEDTYEISSRGFLRSKICNHIISAGCMVNITTLSRMGHHQVGRLVLETFVGSCPKGMICCHKDGDGTNNNIKNLYWGTYKENAEDSIKHGTSCRGGGAHGLKGKTSKLTLAEFVRKISKDKSLTNKQRTKFMKEEFPKHMTAQRYSFEAIYRSVKR